VQYNTIPVQYKFIYMAAISWIKRITITHKQRHAFKITLLEVGQRKRYKRVLKTRCPYEQMDMASQIATVQSTVSETVTVFATREYGMTQ